MLDLFSVLDPCHHEVDITLHVLCVLLQLLDSLFDFWDLPPQLSIVILHVFELRLGNHISVFVHEGLIELAGRDRLEGSLALGRVVDLLGRFFKKVVLCQLHALHEALASFNLEMVEKLEAFFLVGVASLPFLALHLDVLP